MLYLEICKKATPMNFKPFKYIAPFLVYILAIISFTFSGWYVYVGLIYAWLIIPLLELFLQPDESNMNEVEEQLAKQNKLYDYWLYLIVPLQYFIIFYFFKTIESSNSPSELIARIATMGLLCGSFGINVGHELGHRVNRTEQWMAKSLLLTSFYIHFFVEHNKGHHKNVATPEDPSSAPYGQPVYFFWGRSIWGVYKKAWMIANDEMKKKGLPVFHWKNEMIQLQALQILFLLVLFFSFGGTLTAYYLLAALGGILLLETVNYIEHYGLSRKMNNQGNYERAMPHHSWNSNHIIGRLMLFELSRHSDHHYLASRKYQILRHHEDAPQMPTGYPGMMLLVLLPPLFFPIMKKQMLKYNILPEHIS